MSSRISEAFEAATRFDVYAVLHLNRYADGHRGSRQIYDDVAKDFMVRFSKRIRGKTKFRRLPKGHRLLPNMMTVEKSQDGPHLNVMLRMPEGEDIATFRQRLWEEWYRSPWAATDKNAFFCEPRILGSRLIGYNHKDGYETCVNETQTF